MMQKRALRPAFGLMALCLVACVAVLVFVSDGMCLQLPPTLLSVFFVVLLLPASVCTAQQLERTIRTPYRQMCPYCTWSRGIDMSKMLAWTAVSIYHWWGACTLCTRCPLNATSAVEAG